MKPKLDNEKKELILKAALKLITKNGFDATPVSAIAAEAGVAAGTIYLYFQSKEELINNLYLKLKSDLMAATSKNYSDELPVKESFALVWNNYVSYIIDNPIEFQFFEQFTNSPHIQKFTKEEGLKMCATIREIFERGRSEKLIRNVGDGIIYTQLFAPVSNMVKSHHTGEFTLNNETIDTVFEMSWKSISV